METFLNGGSLAGSIKKTKASQKSKKGKSKGKNVKEQVETLIDEGKYSFNFRGWNFLHLQKAILELNGHDIM